MCIMHSMQDNLTYFSGNKVGFFSLKNDSSYVGVMMYWIIVVKKLIHMKFLRQFFCIYGWMDDLRFCILFNSV